jgi:hypothetical protein
MINYDLASEGGMKVFGDGGEDVAGVVQFKSAAANIPALTVGKTVAGSQTIAMLKILGSSLASGALINFAGGFISLTSILTTSAAHFDYAIPVQVGLETRYIPVMKASGIFGGATF